MYDDNINNTIMTRYISISNNVEVEWEGNMISHMAITQQCVDTDHLICP